MNAIEKELRETVCTCSERLNEICAKFLQIIEKKDEEEQVQYIKTLLQEIEPETAEANMGGGFEDLFDNKVSSDDIKELLRLENRIINNLIKEHVAVDEFYHALRNKIFDNSLFENSSTRAAFLLILWTDIRIPYYQLDEGCVMDEDEYSRILEKINPEIKKGMFILNVNFQYKTQRSSFLLEIADKLSNQSEKTVFWSMVIDYLISRYMGLASQFLRDKEKEAKEIDL